jgi:hypothetical protein
VETPPWHNWWLDKEAWSYDYAMKPLKERGLWQELPEGCHFAEYCDEVIDAEDCRSTWGACSRMMPLSSRQHRENLIK